MASKVTSSISGEFVVIDNSAAPLYNSDTTTFTPIMNAGTYLGRDTTWPGATSQGVNAFANGNIPAFLASGTTSVSTGTILASIKYKNPA